MENSNSAIPNGPNEVCLQATLTVSGPVGLQCKFEPEAIYLSWVRREHILHYGGAIVLPFGNQLGEASAERRRHLHLSGHIHVGSIKKCRQTEPEAGGPLTSSEPVVGCTCVELDRQRKIDERPSGLRCLAGSSCREPHNLE